MSKTLLEVWNGGAAFVEYWQSTVLGKELTPVPPQDPSEEYNPEISMKTIQKYFFMLVARYGNSHIVGNDEQIWKDRFCLCMYEFAPAYQQKYKIQKAIRTMNDTDMQKGAIQKSQHGYNPSTDISPDPDTEINSVNDQSLQRWTKSPLDGYNNLLMLLKQDVTEEFISKFKSLFIKVPLTNYWEEEEE